MGKYKEFQSKIHSVRNTTTSNISLLKTSKNTNLVLQLTKEGQISYAKVKGNRYVIYLKKHLGKYNIQRISHIHNTKKLNTKKKEGQIHTLFYVTHPMKKAYLTQISQQYIDQSIKILKLH